MSKKNTNISIIGILLIIVVYYKHFSNVEGFGTKPTVPDPLNLKEIQKNPSAIPYFKSDQKYYGKSPIKIMEQECLNNNCNLDSPCNSSPVNALGTYKSIGKYPSNSKLPRYSIESLCESTKNKNLEVCRYYKKNPNANYAPFYFSNGVQANIPFTVSCPDGYFTQTYSKNIKTNN